MAAAPDPILHEVKEAAPGCDGLYAQQQQQQRAPVAPPAPSRTPPLGSASAGQSRFRSRLSRSAGGSDDGTHQAGSGTAPTPPRAGAYPHAPTHSLLHGGYLAPGSASHRSGAHYGRHAAVQSWVATSSKALSATDTSRGSLSPCGSCADVTIAACGGSGSGEVELELPGRHDSAPVAVGLAARLAEQLPGSPRAALRTPPERSPVSCSSGSCASAAGGWLVDSGACSEADDDGASAGGSCASSAGSCAAGSDTGAAGAAGGAAEPRNAPPCAAVFVGNLPQEVCERKLVEVFSSCGRIQRLWIARDAAHRHSLGYGYVCFDGDADPGAARRAQRELDGVHLLRRRICVRLSGRPFEPLRLAARASV